MSSLIVKVKEFDGSRSPGLRVRAARLRGERYDPAIGGSGRVILKSISADYLARKGGGDNQ